MEKEQNNKVVEKKNMPTVLKILKLSGTPSYLTSQELGVVSTLNLLEFQARNIPTFLLVAQVITVVAVHQLLRV